MPNKKNPVFKKTNKKKKTQAKQQAQQIGLLGRALRYGGGLAGGGLGSLLGPQYAALGANAGSGLGASISRWLGAGAYSVNRNSITSRASQIPNMHQTNDSTVVRHKEFISDIATGPTVSGYSARTFIINPGDDVTFPWLSSIARQYQEYDIKGMVFHYVSTSGDSVGSTTTTLPTVMMATQYRVTAPDFADKVSMLNTHFASDAKASEDFCHPIECDPKENPYNIHYVRGGAVPVGEDPKTYDLGKFTIATTGSQAANVTIGELWCTYEIELKKPYATAQLALYNQSAHYYGLIATTANRFGSSNSFRYDNIGITFPTTNSIRFPVGAVGRYLVSCWWFGAVTASTIMTTAVVNGTLQPIFAGANTAQYVTSLAYVSGGPAVTVLIDIPYTQGAQCEFTLSVGTLTGAATADITITQLPDDFI